MCALAKGKQLRPKTHWCIICHEDSSGAMEADALLSMTIALCGTATLNAL